jgi:hypothetical protein
MFSFLEINGKDNKMSTEYDNDIGIGFPISEDMIPPKYKKVEEEIYHYEHRYDPKTGVQQLKMEKVIDKEEKEVFVFGKSEYDDFREFLEALTESLGCIICEYGNFLENETFFTIELGIQFNGKKVKDLIKLLPKYYKLRDRLHKMGIKVQNEPIIQLQETVG